MFSEKLWKEKVRNILEDYQTTIVSSIKNGYNGMKETKWTFAGAFLYSLTVITTIGESRSYMHVYNQIVCNLFVTF